MQKGQYESSVPVLIDRCHQARVKNALEPEWEARFEPRSYGFRPGRGCQDAIAAIHNVCAEPLAQRVWVLDADLAAAFDKIDHDQLLAALGSFPARDNDPGVAEGGRVRGGQGVRADRGGNPARRCDHAPNTVGNFCFDVTLGYRRLERGR